MRCWNESVLFFCSVEDGPSPKADSSIGSGSFGVIRKVKRKSDGFVRNSPLRLIKRFEER